MLLAVERMTIVCAIEVAIDIKNQSTRIVATLQAFVKKSILLDVFYKTTSPNRRIDSVMANYWSPFIKTKNRISLVYRVNQEWCYVIY